ncbi:sulfite exporter TauE/SafE family protein [Leucobacter alluvii]|uniref:Probable membrane transporter protein n=2 Tax=Leucobacter TaxID=55968 RepID=A0A1H0YGW4_9MICO|nr:sulfite exporter TauE/SafE family protein [Leucobacter chromiiresistens]SDQ14270.1 hypothetical protein SAMN04488565_0852 [Leucobacter chromiiresistens]
MTLPVITAMILATVVGVSLGLLGGGGSILAVPVFTLVLGMETREAIASSLFVVAVTSTIAVLMRTSTRTVKWGVGAAFGVTGMLGGLAGASVGRFVPDVLLSVLFGGVMIVTALAMIRGRRTPASSERPRTRSSHVLRVVIIGVSVGFLTGLLGAGGGFLIVPALLIFGLPIAAATSTSLLVIALNSTAGLAAQVFTTAIPWETVLPFTAFAVAGSVAGMLLARKLSAPVLRKSFGFFVLAVGVVMLTTTILRLAPLL